MEDPIHLLLKKLLATDDPVEFDAVSTELKSMLHERIERLRRDARGLKSKTVMVERRKGPRDGGNAP